MRAAAEQEKSRIRRWNRGTYWTPTLGRLRVAAGHRPGVFSAQDCQSVRIYASEQCPRQDSNLRSRLRRPFPGIALTSRNVLAGVLTGRVSGRSPPTPRIAGLPAGFRLTPHDRHPGFGEAQRRL